MANSDLRRLLGMVSSSGNCWEWTGGKKPSGYGVFYFRGKLWNAHRASWVLHYGEIPNGMLICHRCDNPSCVRPDHLFIGTHVDNSRDMSRKERSRATKLAAADVQHIIARRARGETLVHIAADYGVTFKTVHLIVTGHTWKHITAKEAA